MKITFVSNYLNHHQIPFSEAVIKELNSENDYIFIQTEDMDQERINMGWGVDISKYSYAVSYAKNEDYCKRLLMESDIVIFGGVNDEDIIKPRLDAGKIVIRYSERIYKEGQWKFISPRGLIKKYNDHVKYRNSKAYLFCAGGYVASDYSLIKAYPNKKYVWGYFPAIYIYDDNELNELRTNNKILEIVWSGRMIDWKHPEDVITAVKGLKNAGIDFHLTMVGAGDLFDNVKEMASKNGILDYITFTGFVSPKEVRNYMRAADIYLFTSDFKEGWGAVLNESMNSGCAVIANAAIGAVPYLLKHRENGMVYKNGNIKELEGYLLELAKDAKLRRMLGENAYKTVINEWTPEIAAKRFLRFADNLLNDKVDELESQGPLSIAPIISPSKGYQYTHRS